MNLAQCLTQHLNSWAGVLPQQRSLERTTALGVGLLCGMAFHTNLRWGHRFLQASLVLPLDEGDGHSAARSVPVRWEMAPVVKKPGQRATAHELGD